MTSGRSGSASGASVSHVSTIRGRGRAPRTSSRKRPARSSHSRSTSAGVGEGRPSACSLSDHATFVMTSHTTGRIRRASQRRSRLRAISSGNSGRPWATTPQTWSNFGIASMPDSSGWISQSSPSPSRSRFARSQSWCSAMRGSSRGSPTAMLQAHPSSGGWMVCVVRSLRESTLYLTARCPSMRFPQKIVCPMKPSLLAFSSVSSSRRARCGSHRRRTIAWKHESQYHCHGYERGLGTLKA